MEDPTAMFGTSRFSVHVTRFRPTRFVGSVVPKRAEKCLDPVAGATCYAQCIPEQLNDPVAGASCIGISPEETCPRICSIAPEQNTTF